MTPTDDILALVRKALDEFEVCSLEGSLRRAIRIANLLGDSKTAIRFGLELKPIGGDPSANADDARRLLVDEERWDDPQGPPERAVSEYILDRTFPANPQRESTLSGRVLAHSIGELEFWEKDYEALNVGFDESPDALFIRVAGNQAVLRARHRCFTALCQWERQLTYANVNERIFTRFQAEVDSLLAAGAPELLEKFASMYRRLREAASVEPMKDASEELSQALMTCRRILEAVVDRVSPRDQSATLVDGSPADPSKYRARLSAFVRDGESDSFNAALDSEATGLYKRFEATDKLANKAVHAEVALAEAEVSAILTYVLAGEILQLARIRGSAGSHSASG